MELNSAALNRLKKPSWKDPRLLIGILLVLISVSGVVLLVGSAERSVDAYISSEDIVVGQRLEVGALAKVKVRLNELQGNYFLSGDQFPAGGVAVQLIHKGQLIAKSSVANADGLDRKPVAINLEQSLPVTAQAGDRVDVWVAETDPKTGTSALPKLIMPSAEIATLNQAKSGLMSNQHDVVYVLVGAPQLPTLLHALADKAKISVVLNLSGAHS